MLLTRIDFVIENKINPEIYLSAWDLDKYGEEEFHSISKILKENKLDVTIHAPYMDLSPGGIDQKVKQVTIERFSRVIEIAYHFKPKTIVFHPGYDKWRFDGNVELWLGSSLKTWEPLVDKAEKNGLLLAIENVFEETPDSIKSLLDHIHSPNFRFCFDTGHQNLFSKTTLSQWIECLGDYLVEVHLHDNHKQRDEHLPIGEGGFDFDLFFKLLSIHKINPIYTIEPHEEAHLWRGLKALKKYI
jgi:sugar phosphate isomerase/epimerase